MLKLFFRFDIKTFINLLFDFCFLLPKVASLLWLRQVLCEVKKITAGGLL